MFEITTPVFAEKLNSLFANDSAENLLHKLKESSEPNANGSPVRFVMRDIENGSLESLKARNESQVDPHMRNPNALREMAEGTEIHKKIQDSEICEGRYTSKEVTACDIEGNVLKRERVIESGPRKGDTVLEGSRYDLYSESATAIKTAEIKPYSEQGIYDAGKKLDLQQSIEANGASHGKTVNAEAIFYDKANGNIVLRGPAKETIQQAQKRLNEMQGK